MGQRQEHILMRLPPSPLAPIPTVRDHLTCQSAISELPVMTPGLSGRAHQLHPKIPVIVPYRPIHDSEIFHSII